MSAPIRVTVWNIPEPDELVFMSWYLGGEVFRSGCCFRRAEGRIFTFGAGHQEWPVFHQPEIRQVLANAVACAHGEGSAAVEPRAPREAATGWFEQSDGGPGRRGVRVAAVLYRRG
jgi:trehalose utilization protein